MYTVCLEFTGLRRSAVASINMQNVNGELVFSQLFPTFPVMISGRISGLVPGEHAFHIHEFGDLREGCIKAGDHYNPFHVSAYQYFSPCSSNLQ